MEHTHGDEADERRTDGEREGRAHGDRYRMRETKKTEIHDASRALVPKLSLARAPFMYLATFLAFPKF